LLLIRTQKIKHLDTKILYTYQRYQGTSGN